MILRSLARVSAVALLTAGVVATVAAPAFAEPTKDNKERDVAISVEGLPLRSTDLDQHGHVRLKNKSAFKVPGLVIRYDLTGIDLAKLTDQLKFSTCEPEAERIYICEYGDLRRNEDVVAEQLPVYPIEGATGAAGVVRLSVLLPEGWTDPHPADNEHKVPIVIEGPTGEPTPVPVPVPTPAPTPTVTPTATPTAPPTVTPSVSPTPGGGNGGGDLPLTGPAAIGIALAGIAAVAFGVFLYVTARRRRTRLAAPDDLA